MGWSKFDIAMKCVLTHSRISAHSCSLVRDAVSIGAHT
jgi:hypothetical protein